MQMDVHILFLKPNKSFPIFSYIIRFFQKTDYSHVAIQLDEYILDAKIDGVNFKHVQAYRQHYSIVKRVRVKHNVENLDKIFRWAWQYRKTKYSVLQNIGLGLKQLGFFITNPFGGDSDMIVCSELVALFMERWCGIKIEDSDNYDLIMIEKLAKELMIKQGDA